MTDPRPGKHSEPHIDVDQLISHTELPRTPISDVLDTIVQGVGNIVSYIWIVLMAVIVVNVTLRYTPSEWGWPFGQGYIALEEIQWWLYAIGFLIGLSYCLDKDSHIRIDILHERFSPRTKAWVEFFGIPLFIVPFALIVLYFAVPLVEYSYVSDEASTAPSGLSDYWIIKSFMIVGFALILIAAVSRFLRVCAALFGARRFET